VLAASWRRWHPHQIVTEQRVDVVDNPIGRLELLAGDDEAIASFLDQLDVTRPRDREMLAELARTRTLSDPGPPRSSSAGCSSRSADDRQLRQAAEGSEPEVRDHRDQTHHRGLDRPSHGGGDSVHG
jgi:hypothetical protein